MRRQAAVVGVIATVLSSSLAAQEPAGYTDAQIEAAIQVGYVDDDLDRIMHTCRASVGGFWNKLADAAGGTTAAPLRQFRIHGQPPLARVAEEADFARRAYAPRPTPEDMRPLLGDDVFTIWARPDGGLDMHTARRLENTRIETVVVRPRGRRNVVQPLSVELMDGETYSNLFGASVELVGVVATFDSDAVRAIIAERDLEVLLITAARQEFKCNLDDTRLKRGYDPANSR